MIDCKVKNRFLNKYKPEFIQSVAQETLDRVGKAGCDLSIVVESDHEIHLLNRKYRSIDVATDVLSFSYDEVDPDTHNRYLGDVIISGDKIRQQAAQSGHSEEKEICTLIVHGILHLSGYDHERKPDAKKMLPFQEEIVQSIMTSHKNNGFRSSFGNAIQGFLFALQSERNLKIHFVISLAVLLAAFLLRISAFEWGLVILTIAAVVVSELFNTAIEFTIDLACPEKNELARNAKDISAAAVFMIAIASVVIGLLVFLPKIVRLIGF